MGAGVTDACQNGLPNQLFVVQGCCILSDSLVVTGIGFKRTDGVMIGTIVIADYDPRWPELYAIEKRRITAALGGLLVQIEHVGSTSVPGLAAKPRIDIMPGLATEDDLDRIIEPMVELGFRYVPDYEDEMPYRRLFTRDAGGTQIACNVHTVAVGSEFWERHLLFRDYLRANPDVADEYAQLKRDLAPRFTVTNDYADAKTEFIRSVEARARVELARG
jgi:GrpB-like predicted nucleotidyltransferase (UPF0157 family)